MKRYLDTSAAMKLLVEEAQSQSLVDYLQIPAEGAEQGLFASWLLHTELHCAARRHPQEVDVDSVTVVLDTVSLVDLTRGDLLTAGSLPGELRSHDAIHLAVALRLAVDEVLTYDVELAAAARAAGLHVVAPG